MDDSLSEFSKSAEKCEDESLQLVSQACDAFDGAEYEHCLRSLDVLSRSNCDLKQVQHNAAVVRFYQSECKDHATLLKTLTELSEGSFVAYNMAVIYYHRQMYGTAAKVLTPLVEKSDALKGKLAFHVAILMLRLLLVTNQLNKAHAFLATLQRNLGLNLDAISISDENPTTEGLVTLGDDFSRTLKLLGLVTNVLNRIAVVVPEDGSSELAALKAHQYYIMKDFQMAAKQLKKISSETFADGVDRDELDTCIANNMGVIHLRVRHYALATRFFQKAISFDKKIASNLRNMALQHMGTARSCEILYNLGISMLHLRRPKEAFQCFLVPLKSFHSNPRLWFRMAEACIMDHEIKLHAESKKSVVSSVVTEGTRKVLVLKPQPQYRYLPSSQSAAVPEPNLEFAAMSLRNALTLTLFYKSSFHVASEEEDDEENPKSMQFENTNWQSARDNHFCNPSPQISKEGLDNMLSAIYAAHSYVSLRLGDFAVALEMAQELLKAEKLSDAHRMLAHMYAGEALVMMDKVSEARPYLEPSFVSSLNTFDFETKDWEVKSLDAAQSVVRYNLAVAMTLQGELDHARSLLTTCTHSIVASKVVALKLHLDLRKTTTVGAI